MFTYFDMAPDLLKLIFVGGSIFCAGIGLLRILQGAFSSDTVDVTQGFYALVIGVLGVIFSFLLCTAVGFFFKPSNSVVEPQTTEVEVQDTTLDSIETENVEESVMENIESIE